MANEKVKEFIRKQIEDARDDYVKDLEALPEETLANSQGGSARTAFDFTHEVAFVNRRIAMRLRGETPPDVADEGWIKAPAEFQTKAAAIEDLRSSMDEVLAAWDALPAEDMMKPIRLKTRQGSALEFAYMCAHHTGYHDAQLNYLQSLQGDMEVHWS